MRPADRGDLIPVWARPPRRQRAWGTAGGGRPGLSVAGGVLVLLFLTLNSGMAIYRSARDNDVGAVVSAALAYLNLVTLFACVAMYVRSPPGPDGYSPGRSRLRAAVWLLTTTLTFHYVFEATGTTKPTTLNAAMLLWAMPAATGVAVFYVFFQVDRFGAPWEEEMY